jgi:hypothetical protein
MKKALILSLVMVMIMSLSAFATSTRTLTLGQNNNVLLDDNNVWLYPSRVFQYPNIATGEFARDNGYSQSYNNYFYNFGVNWKFGEKKPWVLGTYFSTVQDFGPNLLELDNPGGYQVPGFYWYDDYSAKTSSDPYIPSNSTSTDKRMDLLYARQFGKYTFGWGFSYTRGSIKSDTTTDKSEAKFGYYGFTWSLTPDNGQWDVALMTNFGTFGTKDQDGLDLVKADGYTDFGVQGRYFWKYNNTITFVPHAGVMFGSHGVKYLNDDSTSYQNQKTKRTAFEFGSGMNYSPVNKVLGVLDFGVAYEKVKYEGGDNGGYTAYNVSESQMYFPYWRVGVEGEVFNWMTLRLGATSNWSIYKWKGNGPYTDKYAENNTYLGVGLNFNRLHIDTYMDPTIVLDGFNFISGSTNAEEMNFHVSVLYDMF